MRTLPVRSASAGGGHLGGEAQVFWENYDLVVGEGGFLRGCGRDYHPEGGPEAVKRERHLGSLKKRSGRTGAGRSGHFF